MNYRRIVIGSLLFLVFTISHAEGGSRHTKCVTKWLDCKDNCEYHQAAAKGEIKACQHACSRQYSCRPRKRYIPKG